MGVKETPEHVEPEDKTVGWYCNGECVAECSKLFGPALEKVCSTCPN